MKINVIINSILLIYCNKVVMTFEILPLQNLQLRSFFFFFFFF